MTNNDGKMKVTMFRKGKHKQNLPTCRINMVLDGKCLKLRTLRGTGIYVIDCEDPETASSLFYSIAKGKHTKEGCPDCGCSEFLTIGRIDRPWLRTCAECNRTYYHRTETKGKHNEHRDRQDIGSLSPKGAKTPAEKQDDDRQGAGGVGPKDDPSGTPIERPTAPQDPA